LSLFLILKTSDILNVRFANHCFCVLVIGILLTTGGCKTTKLVPEGKYLLVKNKLKTSDSGNGIFNKVLSKLDDDKALYIKHKPNRKVLILGRFHLQMYNFGSSKKHPEKNQTKWYRRLLIKNGEAPVILDTLEIAKSEENLKNYLFSKGYFNCDVNHEIKYRKKKAVVTYYIIPRSPYIINEVNVSADDAEIDKFLNANMTASVLKSGEIVDIEAITKERNRLTLVLKNNGYFDFSKDFIDIEMDTIKQVNRVNINISVANKSETERFLRKKINNVAVIFENDDETQKIEPPIRYGDLNFYLNGFPVKPNVIAKAISIREGDIYRYNELENTYNKLSEFTIFKFIDITYNKSVRDSVDGLDAIITVKTNYRQAFTIEPQGIVSQLNRIQNINLSNSYGVANNLVWTHRNLFHNAELFEISANTRIETQLYRDSNTNRIRNFRPAYQQSLNLSLSIPSSSFLRPLESWKRVKSIKTNFNLSFLYEKNPDYLRRILPLTYQFQIQSKRSIWYLNMLEMSFSRNTLGNIPLEGRADSAFIRRLFANNLITSSGLSVFFTDKNTTKSRTHFTIRANILEIGGNLHRLLRRAVDRTKNRDTAYQILKVNYYQYAKTEIDARCSTVLDENFSTAVRFNFGITYPYANQKVVPFDKLFFIGGANSLRAWRPRTVGPGSYSESSKNFRIDRAGNLIMQGSAEYRMDIFKDKLELALFIDAGNVWQIKNANDKDTTINPSKLFNPGTFISQIAMNTGIGLRFDFQFFLFRLDWGMQMHNPEKPLKERWVITDFARNKYFTKYSIVNFGIGYPF
jgi:hypothetical protein